MELLLKANLADSENYYFCKKKQQFSSSIFVLIICVSWVKNFLYEVNLFQVNCIIHFVPLTFHFQVFIPLFIVLFVERNTIIKKGFLPYELFTFQFNFLIPSYLLFILLLQTLMGSSSSIQEEENSKQDQIQAVFKKALKLKEEQNWQKALQLMEKVIQKMPSAQSFAKIGQLFQKTMMVKKAKYFYEKVLEEDPQNTEVLMKLAKLYKEDGKCQDAINKIKKAIKIDGGNFKSFNCLANVQCKQGLFDEAIENMKMGIKRFHQNKLSIQGSGQISDIMLANLYNNLGNSYKYKKQYENALQYYDKAIQLNNENSLFYVNSALCLSQPEIQNYPKAYEYLCEAQKLLMKEECGNPYVLQEVQSFKEKVEEWNFKKNHHYINQKDKEELVLAMNSFEDSINGLFEYDLDSQSYDYQMKITGEQDQILICKSWYNQKLDLSFFKQIDTHIYQLYKREGHDNFAYLPFNIIIYAINSMISKHTKLEQLQKSISSCLQYLCLKFPASQSNSSIYSSIQSFSNPEYQPNMFSNSYFKSYENLLSEINKIAEKAKAIYPQFHEFTKQICLEIGSSYKSGLKFPQNSSQSSKSKVMIRVVEKIFKELKDYKQEMLENVDEKLAGSNKMSMKDITNTFFQVWKEKVEWILRKRMEEKKETKCFIYDFIRAKCMFDSVQGIESTFSKILTKCEQKSYKVIEVDNRINKNTKDIVIKIQIKNVVGEIQLCLQFDSCLNEFNHGIYEIKRSPGGGVFGSLLWLGQLKGLTIINKINAIFQEIKNVSPENQKLNEAKVCLKYVLQEYQKLKKGLN